MDIRGISVTRIRLLVVLGALGGVAAGCAPKNAWREVVTPHFVLHTDVSRAQARATLTQLERSFDVFHRLVFASRRPPPGRSEVVLLRRRADYAQVAPGIVTAHATAEPHDVLGRSLLLLAERLDSGSLEVVQHELVHRFVRHELHDVPYWFNEGLASFLSTMTYDEEEVDLGTPPVPPPGLEARPSLPPLAELLGEPAGFFDLKKGPAYHYAAWNLVHLLATGTIAQRQRLIEFTNALGRGADRRAAWQAGFWDQRVDELETEYRRHAESASPRFVRTPFRVRASVRRERERVLPAAEVHLLWVRLLPWEKANRPRVEAELRAATGLDAAERRYWWGRLYTAQGRREEAERELRGALALRPGEERYALALAELLTSAPSAGEAHPPSAPAAEDVLAQLGRVAESAVSLDFLARQKLARGETEPARELALRAVARDAGCWQCVDTLAQIEFARGAVPEAVDLAERAVGLIPDDVMHPDLLQRLTAYRQAAVSRGTPPAKP
ncbi:MAG TPA: hypothetical protein VH877_16945 [Polyangia bacterium]|nr:hypothetical protein [Polyangia bacterium]